MIYEYAGTFLKFVVVVRGTGSEAKAECKVIDLRKLRDDG